MSKASAPAAVEYPAPDGRSYFVHPTALCESPDVGPRTRIWAFAHVLAGARIGSDCNVCDHAYVENGVVVGNRVTIKNRVLLFEGVTVDDDVFLGPGVTFTNDLRPRAFTNSYTLTETIVRTGATVGAGVVVVCGTDIGAYSFIGAGAVVTRSVPAHAFVVGNPGKIAGWVCTCNLRLDADLRCICGASYRRSGDGLVDAS